MLFDCLNACLCLFAPDTRRICLALLGLLFSFSQFLAKWTVRQLTAGCPQSSTSSSHPRAVKSGLSHPTHLSLATSRVPPNGSFTFCTFDPANRHFQVPRRFGGPRSMRAQGISDSPPVSWVSFLRHAFFMFAGHRRHTVS
jgi:hypothetical protein